MPEASKKNPLGPTGVVAARRVKKLRDARKWTYQRLSEELAKRGRSIPPLGLRRIEAEERRIDADDLVALAAAFDVAPAGLLFPVDARGVVEVTGIGPISVEELWEWVDGRTSLSDEPDPDGARADQFTLESRPRHFAEPDLKTPAGRHRFAREVDGKRGYEVVWADDGDVVSIAAVSPDDPRRRMPIWPDEDDDQ